MWEKVHPDHLPRGRPEQGRVRLYPAMRRQVFRDPRSRQPGASRDRWYYQACIDDDGAS